MQLQVAQPLLPELVQRRQPAAAGSSGASSAVAGVSSFASGSAGGGNTPPPSSSGHAGSNGGPKRQPDPPSSGSGGSLASVGGEPLAGSGFETEKPAAGFSSSTEENGSNGIPPQPGAQPRESAATEELRVRSNHLRLENSRVPQEREAVYRNRCNGSKGVCLQFRRTQRRTLHRLGCQFDHHE